MLLVQWGAMLLTDWMTLAIVAVKKHKCLKSYLWGSGNKKWMKTRLLTSQYLQVSWRNLFTDIIHIFKAEKVKWMVRTIRMFKGKSMFMNCLRKKFAATFCIIHDGASSFWGRVYVHFLMLKNISHPRHSSYTFSCIQVPDNVWCTGRFGQF